MMLPEAEAPLESIDAGEACARLGFAQDPGSPWTATGNTPGDD